MGIRDSSTYVAPNYNGNHWTWRVQVTTPLTSVDGELGWYTHVDLYPVIVTRTWRPGEIERLATITRVTTPVKRGTSGGQPVLRRKVAGVGFTRDDIELWTSGGNRKSTTRYPVASWRGKYNRRKYHNYDVTTLRDSWAKNSFDVSRFCAVVVGITQERLGQPLLDYLREFSPEVAPYLDEPGWIPKTRAEFKAVKDARTEEHNRKLKAMAAAVRGEVEVGDLESDDETQDRWR